MRTRLARRILALAITSAMLAVSFVAPSASAQTITGSVTPTNILQGESVVIVLSLSGGLPLANYSFSITVTNPPGSSTTSQILFQADLTGSGSGSTIYPSNFAGANTNQTGTYSVRADQTSPTLQSAVWTGSFTVSSPPSTTTTTTTTTTLPPPQTTTTTTVPGFDFSLAVIPANSSVSQGQNVTASVIVERVSGASEIVTLSARDNLGGTSINLVPSTGFPSFTSRLRVSTSNSTQPGAHTFTITGIGGGKVRSTSFTLMVREITTMKIEVSTFVDSKLREPSSTFKRGQIIFLKASVAYQNASTVTVAQTTFSLYDRTLVLKFDRQFGSWLGSFPLSFSDPTGNQTASITVVDAEGNRVVTRISLTVNPSALAVESFSARDEAGFPRLSFTVNETVYTFFRVRYENGSHLTNGKYSIQLRAPNGYTIATMVAAYDGVRFGFYTDDGYRTSLRDIVGQWTAIVTKTSIDDGNGNRGPSADFSHAFTVLKPSIISPPELNVGFYSDSEFSAQRSRFLGGDVAYVKVDAKYSNGTVVSSGGLTVRLGREFYPLAFDPLLKAWVGTIPLSTAIGFGPKTIAIFLDDGRGAFVRKSAEIYVEEVVPTATPWFANIQYPAVLVAGSAVAALLILRRRTVDLEYIDSLTGGGIPERSSVMLLGEEGSGKTTLALSLICRDLQKGKPALVLSYDNFPESVVKRMATLGCTTAESGNSFRVLDCYTGQADPRTTIEPFNVTNLSILISSELNGIKGARVLVDSTVPLFNALDHKQVLSFLQALSVKVKQQDGILFSTLSSQSVPVETLAKLEALMDGVLDLVVRNEKGIRHRYLTVKKMHERRIADAPTPFVISKEGKVLFKARRLRLPGHALVHEPENLTLKKD